MMAVMRTTYVSKKTGETKVYVYHYHYYTTAEERALACLKKRPLQRMRKQNGDLAYKWTAGQRGPVFHDTTIVKLIKKKKVVCLGDFVELAGKVR